MKKKIEKVCSILNIGAIYFWLTCFQSSKINTGNQAIRLNLGYPLSIHSSWNSIFTPTISLALSLNLDHPYHGLSLSVLNSNWGSHFVCNSNIPIIHPEFGTLFTLRTMITLRTTCEDPVIFPPPQLGKAKHAFEPRTILESHTRGNVLKSQSIGASTNTFYVSRPI